MPSYKSLSDRLIPALEWFDSKGWKPFDFQIDAWNAILDGHSGLVNAPTGSGKTYSLFVGCLLKNVQEKSYKGRGRLRYIWVTPIRALAKEIKISCDRAIEAFGFDWQVEIRTGDTSTSVKQRQRKAPPEVLITTPESLHVLLSSKGHSDYFKHIDVIVVDEWHELMGSKRGVQTELFLAYLRHLNPEVMTWGISATIGNLDLAREILVGTNPHQRPVIIKAAIDKKIEVVSLIPDKMETYPWAGHIGIKMAQQIVPIIHKSKTTLIFTNTRAQCEIWYQKLLEIDEDLAGAMAMHHGSIDKKLRDWVEDALYEGKLKAVVCTSSLDLGVDFRPVETIIQIGSPKGVSRFVQRAGRSGHAPGMTSYIYFVPTHSIELLEASALRAAIHSKMAEDRIPYVRAFDVLVQFLITLAVSDGFRPDIVWSYVRDTYCYSFVSEEEWQATLAYLRYGSQSLRAYDEYHKVEVIDGVYKVVSRGIAMRHRMSIGTIVSDAMMNVRYVKGKQIGVVEEWFLTQLNIGDAFWFAGRCLELVRIKELTAQVKDSNKKTGKVPSYMGGRIQLSSQLSDMLKERLEDYHRGRIDDEELKALVPLFEKQSQRSILPKYDELLVEYFETTEGHHLLIYPFEGRYVHEGMGALIAKRISRILPISFSIAMNDYGFELLSDKKIDIEDIITYDLFSTKELWADIQSSINAVEMAKRKFRDIAVISGLVFQGFPGKEKKQRHLQSSSQLLFSVFEDYDPDNILYRQTYEEVMTFQLEEARLRKALDEVQQKKIVFSFPTKPTPLSFPILVDVLRERLTSERLEDRIQKMTLEIEGS